MHRALEHARTRIHDGDWLGLAMLLLRTLPRDLLHARGYWWTRGDRVPDFPRPKTITLRRLRPSERLPDTYGALLDESLSGHVFRSAFENEHQCYIALRNDQIVGYGWAELGPNADDNDPFRPPLKAEEAYTYRTYVAPAYRFSKVYGALSTYILSSLRQQGVRYFVGCGDWTNRHSLKTHQRMGYEIAGWFLVFELPGLDIRIERVHEGEKRLRCRFQRRRARWPWARKRSKGLVGGRTVETG